MVPNAVAKIEALGAMEEVAEQTAVGVVVDLGC